HDDQPRLVLADWLDDHGQHERAEYVRLQQREPLHDGSDWYPEAAASWAREMRLLRQHVGEWLGGAQLADSGWCSLPDGEDEDDAPAYRFRRGLALVQVGPRTLKSPPLAFAEDVRPWLEAFETGHILEPPVERALLRDPALEAFSDVTLSW